MSAKPVVVATSVTSPVSTQSTSLRGSSKTETASKTTTATAVVAEEETKDKDEDEDKSSSKKSSKKSSGKKSSSKKSSSKKHSKDDRKLEEAIAATPQGWSWGYYPNLDNNDFQAACASDDGKTIVVAVFGGSILHTTDGGSTWDVNEDQNTAEWADITCSADGAYVVAVSTEGYVYYSSNAGEDFNPSDNDNSVQYSSVASSRSVVPSLLLTPSALVSPDPSARIRPPLSPSHHSPLLSASALSSTQTLIPTLTRTQHRRNRFGGRLQRHLPLHGLWRNLLHSPRRGRQERRRIPGHD